MAARLTEVDLPSRLAPGVPPVVSRALTGVAFAALPIVLRYAIHQVAPGVAPFALIFPAVLAATMLSGWMAGAIALILAGVADWAFFLSGHDGPGIPDLRDVIELALFTSSAAVMVFLTEAFVQRARADARHRVRDLEQARLDHGRQVWIAQEMNHRVKNVLSIVQNIARQTFRNERADQSARAEFDDRLGALAEAHGLLVEGGWRPVSLRRLIERAVAPFSEQIEDRFHIEGPATQLPPASAVAMALAVHELATNAAKYGALSNTEGQIHILWRLGDGPTPQYELDWREIGGPVVAAPAARGFGSRLIEQGLAHELGGAATLRYPPSGVTCTVTWPTSPAEAAADRRRHPVA